jgi:malonyl-CoA O-methyltransferase
MRATNGIDPCQVRRNFSRNARHYDRYARVQKRIAGNIAALVAQEGPNSGRLLEVGTGTGYLTERLLQCCPGLEPVVSDLAHGMTRRARERVPQALAVDGDAAALPLVSGCTAWVCCASVYQWVADLKTAFDESHRVLQEGGCFAFALFGRGTLHELHSCYRLAARMAGKGEPQHLQQLPDRARVTQALRRSRFDRWRVWQEREIEHHDTVSDLLRSLKGIGAQNASMQRPRGLGSGRMLARLERCYRQQFAAGGPLPATYEVIYGFACKKG